MDEDQLAELEMHLAAGTDLPTALAAVSDDQPPNRRGVYVAGVLALIVGLLIVLLLQ